MSLKKAAYGCSRTPPLPAGLFLKDVKNKNWTLGKTVGSGGFGDIYLVIPEDPPADARAEFVVKVEPHDNGPLFVEMHFFMRVAQAKYIDEWNEKNSNRPVRMPTYQGSGSFLFGGKKYRFLIMERFGRDLDKFFEGGKRIFSLQTIQIVSNQVINTLEFVHSMSYSHNDIKAQNLLLGLGTEGQDEVYLVDYGLACKFVDRQGYHKDGDPDERKAHDGTMEYTSRDAHTGAHSRRGDLETLGYNLIHWMTGELPWMDSLDNPEGVAAMKSLCMKDIPALLKWCFRSSDYPEALLQYLKYVSQLKFESVPDYEQLRMLVSNFSEINIQKLNFMDSKLKELSEETPVPMMIGLQSPNTRRRRNRNDPNNDSILEDVFNSDPNAILRQSGKQDEVSEKEAAFDKAEADSLLNPTEEMLRIMKLNHDNKWSWRNVNKDGGKTHELQHKEDTPAMERVKSRIKELRVTENLNIENNDSFLIPSTPINEESNPIPELNHSISLISGINEAKILNFEVIDSITMDSPQREKNNFSWNLPTISPKEQKSSEKENTDVMKSPQKEPKNFSWHHATIGQKHANSPREKQNEDSIVTNSPQKDFNISWNQQANDQKSPKYSFGMIKTPQPESRKFSWNQPTLGQNNIKCEVGSPKEDSKLPKSPQKEDNFLWNRPSVIVNNKASETKSPDKGSNSKWNWNRSLSESNDTSVKVDQEKMSQTNAVPLFHSIFGEEYLNDLNTFVVKPEENMKNISPKDIENSNAVAQTNEEIMAAFLQENSMEVTQRASKENDNPIQNKLKSTTDTEIIIPNIKQEENMETFIKKENVYEEIQYPFVPMPFAQAIKQERSTEDNMEAFKKQKISLNMPSVNASNFNTNPFISPSAFQSNSYKNSNEIHNQTIGGHGNFLWNKPSSVQQKKRSNSISFLDRTPTKQETPFMFPAFQAPPKFKSPRPPSKPSGSPMKMDQSPNKSSTKEDNEVKILKVFLKPSRFNINGITPFIKSEPQDEVMETPPVRDNFFSSAHNKITQPPIAPLETPMEMGKNTVKSSNSPSKDSSNKITESEDNEVQVLKVSIRPSKLNSGGVGPFIKSEPRDDSMDSSTDIRYPNNNPVKMLDHDYCAFNTTKVDLFRPPSINAVTQNTNAQVIEEKSSRKESEKSTSIEKHPTVSPIQSSAVIQTSEVNLFQPININTFAQESNMQLGDKKSSQNANQELPSSAKLPFKPHMQTSGTSFFLPTNINTFSQVNLQSQKENKESPSSIQTSTPIELTNINTFSKVGLQPQKESKENPSPIQINPVFEPKHNNTFSQGNLHSQKESKDIQSPIQTSTVFEPINTFSQVNLQSQKENKESPSPIKMNTGDSSLPITINVFSQVKEKISSHEGQERSPLTSSLQTNKVNLFKSTSLGAFPQVKTLEFGEKKTSQNMDLEKSHYLSRDQEAQPFLRADLIVPIETPDSYPEMTDIDTLKNKTIDTMNNSDKDIVKRKSKKIRAMRSKKVKPKNRRRKVNTSPKAKISPKHDMSDLRNKIKEGPGLTPTSIKRQSLLRKTLRTSFRPNYALMNSHGLDDIDIANINEETRKASWHGRFKPKKTKKKRVKQIMKEAAQEGTVDNLLENMLLEGNLM